MAIFFDYKLFSYQQYIYETIKVSKIHFFAFSETISTPFIILLQENFMNNLRSSYFIYSNSHSTEVHSAIAFYDHQFYSNNNSHLWPWTLLIIFNTIPFFHEVLQIPKYSGIFKLHYKRHKTFTMICSLGFSIAMP